MKGPGKEPEPGNGDQRGIETNQVEPGHRCSRSGRDSPERFRGCPGISWWGVNRHARTPAARRPYLASPYPGGKCGLNGLAPFPIDLILSCLA